MMEPTRPPGPRPLPNPPTGMRPSPEAQWYEVEERNRPSYIVAPRPVNAARQQFQQPPAHLPPLSPSARYQNQAAAFPPQQSQQYFQQPQQQQQGQRLPPGAANPYQYGQQQQQQQQQRSWAANNEPVFANSGVARGKGSAFMHKGFFDIMSLVNNRDVPANSRLLPPAGYKGDRQINSSPSRIRTTLSKATGGLRKMSLGAGAGEPFFAGPAASPIASPSAASLEPPRPLGQMRDSMDSSYQHPSPSASSAAVLGGPRAAKKRISIDMVSAPRPESFVHAAHASDADQAEAILHRWSRDGVGKIADPRWVEPIKEAMRMQAARNQAEAIAQVQAALHQDSMIRENPRPLHIMNGAASPSQLTVTSTITSATGTTATLGHGSMVPPSNAVFQGIREETRGSDGEARDAPYAELPAAARVAPPSATRPLGPPRTNTGGTMVINPTPDGQARAAPDYMAYKPAETGPDASRPLSGVPLPDDRRESKAIDGLPGSGVPAGIGAMFDPPTAPTSARPESMLVRDAIQSYATGLTPTLATTTTAPLDGEDGDEAMLVLGAAVRPSLTTVEKSVAAKIYFENLYYGILKKPRARDTRRAGLEAELNVLRISDGAKEAIRQAWAANETEHLRDLRARVNVNSFHRLKTIGHGAFGVVALVRERGSGELFAMKQLRKADMLRKGQEGHVRAERDLMTSASASANAKWIVKLVYSFQDVDHLYLIMEFMGGGDLLNLLIEKDIFAEDFAKFYVAEMILAIHEAHRLGYIHRDIKPDNFLFTSQGHVKLADFGLCQSFHWAHDGAYYDQQRKNLLRKHGIDLDDSPAGRRGPGGGRVGAGGKGQGNPGAALSDKELADVLSDRNEDGTPMTHVLTWRDKNKKKMAFSVVGTNNYMAPEVLRGLGYDQSCDWWSLGVIVFEMLYGYPPFVSKSRHLTRQKILNWRQTLRFPPKPKVSREAQDFIQRLVCEKEDRLGSTSTASVSRPNSIIQGARRSGFLPGQGGAGGLGGSSGLIDGVDDLMAHPWFRGIDWGNIHSQSAPFKPALSHPADTKHFEDDIDDEPLPAPGAAEAGPNAPAEQARDPMLRDKAHGEHLLEMRKQLAFVGYTFKSPKHFDPRTQLDERNVAAAEAAQAQARAYGLRQQQQDLQGWSREPTEGGSRVRSMSM